VSDIPTPSCRRHEIDPQLYLTQLLMNLPQDKMSDLPTWLPDQWKPRKAAQLAGPECAIPSAP